MKFFYTRTIIALFILSIVSCNKNLDPVNQGQVPDLETKVTASVTGFVTNESGAAVQGATVTAGSSTVTTDEFGRFVLNNVLVVKDAAVITVKHSSYFNGIRTVMAEEGKENFVRIQLLEKSLTGSVDASVGGTVSASNGLAIALPASGVTLNGAIYGGQVNVFAKWIDPTSSSLSQQMPGDLRAVNTQGYGKLLETYGMVAVELETPGGDKLEVASGKKASVTFPLPASLSGTAPSTIPLWHFNEETGLWVEEGQAIKTGNSYVGEVSHFSFWNVDIPMNFIQLSLTLVDSEGNPVPYVQVKLTLVSNPNVSAYGYTDSTGFTSGPVFANSTFMMHLVVPGGCSIPVQTFTVGNTNQSLGTIVVSLPTSMVNLSGTVTDCNNQPLGSGYIVVHSMGLNSSFPVNNGVYNFNYLSCGNSFSASIVAMTSPTEQSDPVTQTINPGNNIIPNLQVCAAQLAVYDGRYTLKGFHNRPSYQYPYETEMHMVTVAPNSVAFYWPAAGSWGHPFAVDASGSLSWYGPTFAPVVSFDPATNLVTNVTGSDPQGPLMSLYSGPVSTNNYYDPVTKKIYVAFEYNNNPDRAFFDTLTYIGPR